MIMHIKKLIRGLGIFSVILCVCLQYSIKFDEPIAEGEPTLVTFKSEGRDASVIPFRSEDTGMARLLYNM